ncbi:DUF3846 domain-containing protein [Mammaliicoccus sciuri]|uniref:DUF3846 domain-containing protein n=1 Tax=Mammaliicoccus sciuri TaxID=1296 RepID=UPI002B25B4F6|nr:hypothetical protein [Mammaliicoccus sciuri]WQK75260.1 hypothetical protein P3U33_05880 [Mammaliicoccus sciuri]
MGYLLYDENKKELIEINQGEEETLKFLYKHLDCNTVQVVMMTNGITAWVDENALLTNNYTHVHDIIDGRFVHSMVGNIIFSSTNGEEIADLSKGQIDYIKNELEIKTQSVEEYLKNNKTEYNDGI